MAEDLAKSDIGPLTLWIEAQFEFPELKRVKRKYATIPGHFAHMQLESADGIPRVRFRLTATVDEDGDIEETMYYIVQTDEHDEPVKTVPVTKHDRNAIQVHYLPARRDPTDHISYAANSLLGRALRAADWQAEREEIAGLTQYISKALAGNAAVESIGEQLTDHWAALHKGIYYASPSVSFERNEIENLLRHLTVGFTPESWRTDRRFLSSERWPAVLTLRLAGAFDPGYWSQSSSQQARRVRRVQIAPCRVHTSGYGGAGEQPVAALPWPSDQVTDHLLQDTTTRRRSSRPTHRRCSNA